MGHVKDHDCVAIILKPSVTCFSNVVKYNTYGKFALEKWKCLNQMSS